VKDKSGVLATIAQTFAEQDVSIQTVDQNGRGADAELIIVTHGATEGELKATVSALKKLPIVTKISSVIRVEGSTSL
jgi:homoserine dehydrogenase